MKKGQPQHLNIEIAVWLAAVTPAVLMFPAIVFLSESGDNTACFF